MGDFVLLKMCSNLYLNKIGTHEKMTGVVTMYMMDEEVIWAKS